MLIKWVATRALELILSRLRATLKDHLSIYLACLQDLKNGPKSAIFKSFGALTGSICTKNTLRIHF